MKLAYDLFARFGLFGTKADAPDFFDLRLERTRSRENRLAAKQVLFKTRSALRAA